MIPKRMDTETVSVVLVTNVGQGFGRAIALAYGDADFDVVCADRDVDLASKTAAEIEEAGGQAIPIQTGMTTAAEVRKAFDKVYEIFGDLSGVVHVINFESRTPFTQLTEGELAELLEETLRSTFLTLKTAARYLKGAWLVLIAPPLSAKQPQMAAIQGALTALVERYRDTVDITINVVVPSRAASDPMHDAPLVDNVMYLGGRHHGVNGQRIIVKLPPPPRVIEALLPEVRAALDESLGQEELEASLYADAPELLATTGTSAAGSGLMTALGEQRHYGDGHYGDVGDDTSSDNPSHNPSHNRSDNRSDSGNAGDEDDLEPDDSAYDDINDDVNDNTDDALDALAAQGLPDPEDTYPNPDDDDGADYDYYSDYSDYNDTYAAYALSGDDSSDKSGGGDPSGYPTEAYTQYEPDGEDAADVYRRSRRIRRDGDD